MEQRETSNHNRIKGVIFDLGATLLYFDGEWPAIMAHSHGELLRELRAAGLELEEEAFLTDFRSQLDAYYAEREAEFIEYTTLYVLRDQLARWGYPEVAETVLRRALRKMYTVTETHWKPENDTLTTLKSLRAEGYRLGLISNAGDDEDVQTLIDNAGLRQFFEIIVTSAAQGIRKPNPRIFQLVLDFWDLPPDRTVMVGDTLGADILGARNAGIYSIWITRRAGTPSNQAHQDTIIPDATIATLAELPALLQKIE
jgi:HAD superfamily hydrolase (TIGR01662 family)